jgi:hypothetical protein
VQFDEEMRRIESKGTTVDGEKYCISISAVSSDYSNLKEAGLLSNKSKETDIIVVLKSTCQI